MQTVTVSHNYLKQLESRVKRLEQDMSTVKAHRKETSLDVVDEARSTVAQQLLDTLVCKLGPIAEKEGLTEERLVEEIRETRKDVFQEFYGGLTQ
jgi:uncharacterized protein (UPF0335 family)